MNSQFAMRAASSISAGVASVRSYAMFSAIVPEKRTGSCGTSPIFARQDAGVRSRMSGDALVSGKRGGYNNETNLGRQM